MVILILIAFILIAITANAIVQFSRKKKSKTPILPIVSSRFFNEASVSIPQGIYFDKTHTWAFMEKNGLVKIGIDDFLLHITGPLNRVKMKTTGEKIQKGEPLISIIQKGKQLVISAPISGTIRFLNNKLIEDPLIVNSSPFNDGWIYTVEPSNWLRDIQFMIMADIYKKWLKNEFSRVKDFFAVNGQPNNAEFVPIMIQDGGELKENALADLGPEVWEEFQTKFINTSNYIDLVLNFEHKFTTWSDS